MVMVLPRKGTAGLDMFIHHELTVVCVQEKSIGVG